MNYSLIRNATAMLTIGGSRFLIDPMLDPAGARPPIDNTPNQHPNPLVPLPEGWEALIADPDAYVITHLHNDHFDEMAAATISQGPPLFCQPEDVERHRATRFLDIRPVDTETAFDEVTITRTAAEHGTGEIGALMAPVSGFVFDAPNDSRTYLAGDTVWCGAVASTIYRHTPEVIILNAGGARFLDGAPIVMTAADIVEVHEAAPDALLVIVHLEAINHCLETRAYYRDVLPAMGIPLDRLRIPEDGEQVIW